MSLHPSSGLWKEREFIVGKACHTAALFYHREGFVSGSGDSVSDRWDNVMCADSRALGYHISLPKQLPNCGVDALLLREPSRNQNTHVGLSSSWNQIPYNFDVQIMQPAMKVISFIHCRIRFRLLTISSLY